MSQDIQARIDTFQYAISDGNVGTAIATVIYYVYPPNETDYTNTIDDDGDGLIDCLGPDCLTGKASGVFKG